MNGIQPRVSVVVPVYNGAGTIAACLDSLTALQYPEALLDIIVVDNASTDQTPDILQAYRKRTTLLTESRRGPSAARNCGVRAAQGEIIAFTDADCVVDSEWLTHLIRPLADPSAGIVGGRILAKPPANAVEKFGETIHDHQKAIEVYRPPYVITMNWASPRKILMEAGLFNEAYKRCEDVDLSQRIITRGFRAIYQHHAIVYHSNENSYSGLMREGFQHGLWAVRHNKDHQEINRRSGHRRINMQSYLQLGRDFMDGLNSNLDPAAMVNARCQGVFDLGKKLGKVAGSIRFRHLDL